MSYCVNCGVELNPSAKTCPLCGTPAWHPELDAPPYFPANSAAVQPASRREAAILLTAMLVSVSLCCGLLNLFLPTDRPWSLYVIGAAVMLWVWFTLPMVLRRLPVFFPAHRRCGGHWHLCLAHLHRPGRQPLVPGAGPAPDRLGWGAGLSFELSAPGRAALHPLRHCPGHRGGWASGDGY